MQQKQVVGNTDNMPYIQYLWPCSLFLLICNSDTHFYRFSWQHTQQQTLLHLINKSRDPTRKQSRKFWDHEISYLFHDDEKSLKCLDHRTSLLQIIEKSLVIYRFIQMSMAESICNGVVGKYFLRNSTNKEAQSWFDIEVHKYESEDP